MTTRAIGKQAQADILSWAGKDGSFKRLDSAFRTKTIGSPEAGRFQLIGSHSCPWFHRINIIRKLKGLEDIIPLVVLHPYMGSLGWSFGPPARGESNEYLPATLGQVGAFDGITGVDKDPHYDFTFLREYCTSSSFLISICNNVSATTFEHR